MRVLVTGGAGYIGSHAAKALARAGDEPVVYDNLSRGHAWAVKWGPLVEGDIRDAERLRHTLRRERIEAVLHFAALAYVDESMRQPAAYLDTNSGGSLTLLQAMQAEGVELLVLSSSCATYGVPERLPVDELSSQAPLSPYGESKLMMEKAALWCAGAGGPRYAVLRYFNAAGADPDAEIGESHQPETHLLPLALEAALNIQQPLRVYGTDYPTPDGTAIRDYVHVTDLAEAHLRALDHLRQGGRGGAFNLGSGRGHSVREVIAAAERVSGASPAVLFEARRAGDAPALVADTSRAREVLGWTPARSDLNSMVETAWRWRRMEGRPEERQCSYAS
jgi:UDP-arabinose 4-epimerase